MMKHLSFAIFFALFSTLSLAAQSLDGAWKGTLQAGPQKLTLTFSINAAERTATLAVLEQGAAEIPLAVGFLSADSVALSLDAYGISYAAHLSDGALVGTYRQGMFSAPLLLERGAVELVRPQTPVPPFPYTTEEVRFAGGSDGVELAGTLTLPEGCSADSPVPVVVMVTGSGPQDRDEQLFGHKPFLVLADYLARHGIASLRYDDRGVGASTGDFEAATTTLFAADARGAVRWARRRAECSKVGILGHSEGGIIAFMLGSEGAADFVVSLAGPAGRIDSLMAVQLTEVARENGGPLPAPLTPEQAVEALLVSSDGPWMREFVALDVAPFVAGMHCPVFALGAEADINVPPAVNTPSLERGLSGNAEARIKVYPGLNHLFQHAPRGLLSLAAGIEETMSAEVLADIASWISSVAGRR